MRPSTDGFEPLRLKARNLRFHRWENAHRGCRFPRLTCNNSDRRLPGSYSAPWRLVADQRRHLPVGKCRPQSLFARLSRARQQGDPGKWEVALPGFDGPFLDETDGLLAHRHALLGDVTRQQCTNLSSCKAHKEARRTNDQIHNACHHQPEEVTSQGCQSGIDIWLLSSKCLRRQGFA